MALVKSPRLSLAMSGARKADSVATPTTGMPAARPIPRAAAIPTRKPV
jgi:hypothetical protein